jgi:phage repressor protein C with HTH and peptisase S24 domain
MLIGERIRQAREKKRLTQEQLGQLVGVTDAAVSQWETGGIQPAQKNLAKIAQALGVTRMWLLDGDTAGPSPSKHLVTFHERDLPVYGAALGGDGAIMLNRGEQVDRIHRPAALADVKDAFAVVIAGDSMEPRFMQGDVAYIHPHKPPAPRRGVLIELQEGDAHIKEFVSQDDEWIKVRQHNPPKDLKYKRAQVKRLYRVIGTVEY